MRRNATRHFTVEIKRASRVSQNPSSTADRDPTPSNEAIWTTRPMPDQPAPSAAHRAAEIAFRNIQRPAPVEPVSTVTAEGFSGPAAAPSPAAAKVVRVLDDLSVSDRIDLSVARGEAEPAPIRVVRGRGRPRSVIGSPVPVKKSSAPAERDVLPKAILVPSQAAEAVDLAAPTLDETPGRKTRRDTRASIKARRNPEALPAGQRWKKRLTRFCW